MNRCLPPSIRCRLRALSLTVLLLAVVFPTESSAQTFRTDDPVVQRMWDLGMDGSQTRELAHSLIDSIGPRLAGSPELLAAQDWLMSIYAAWGVEARKEEYGEWDAWRQGTLHVDLVEPRVQSLDAEMMAWSPATDGPVDGTVVMPPVGLTASTLPAWLESVQGRYVMISPPEPMCRAPQELVANARPETVAAIEAERLELRREWGERVGPLGRNQDEVEVLLDGSGVAGILSSRWSNGWGVNKVFDTPAERVVSLDISCEDYGLLYRMAVRGEEPVLRVDADSEDLGMNPLFNVIAELPGSELPDEYVLLSAHLDSWHAATGATDNGTGTIMMLEAMRILKEAYPNPRRTILVGHWGPEEVGLTGSRSFTEDHPEVLEGLQVMFNQDNGTWRVERIEGQGFLYSGQSIGRWMSRVPPEISDHIALEFPGAQNNSGSDHTSFVCRGVPAFRFQSGYDEYRQYTWHTNRDTYDKIVFDDLKENATLAAMMVYAASEDPERTSREVTVLPPNPRTGQPRAWPTCSPARRSTGS